MTKYTKYEYNFYLRITLLCYFTICTYVRTCLCVHAHMHTYVHTHTVHTYAHMFMRMYICIGAC